MVAKKQLAIGDELCRESIRTALGLSWSAHSLAMWDLVVSGVVTRVDHRLFWGDPPAHTRSKQQMQLSLLALIADGEFLEGESFPSAIEIGTAYNGLKTDGRKMIRFLAQLELLGGTTRKYVAQGAQRKAQQAASDFTFTLTSTLSTIDSCFSLLQQAPSDQEAADALRGWLRKNRSETRFLCSRLLRHFGVAELHESRRESIHLYPIATKGSRLGLEKCRYWLRRGHFITFDDTKRARIIPV